MKRIRELLTVPVALVPVALVLVAVVLAGCGSSKGADQEDAQVSGTELGDGNIGWGTGKYGVVMAHGAAFDAESWYEQAEKIALLGATVISVEDTSETSIAAAMKSLQDRGIDRVALIGGSAGSDAILSLSSRMPDLADQLILLSPNSTVDGLGDQPKLFVASEDEPVVDVSRELARSAPGDDNVAMILPGSAHAQNIFDTDQGPKVLEAMLDRIKARVPA